MIFKRFCMNIQSFFETINELLLFHIFSYGILETCTGCLNYKEHIHAEFSTCGLFVCLFIFRFLEHKYSFNIKTYNICFFFLSGFSFTNTDDSQDSRGREGTVFYSILPLLPAHEHSDIYLELCRWDDYHIFLNAPLVFTRLLLDDIYHLIE